MAGVGVKKTEFVWMDGKLIPWDEATLPLLTHSFHYGVAAFEGIRSYATADGKSAIFRLREHIRRLFESAHICLMEMPFTAEQVEKACVELLRANKMQHGYLRPLAFHGDGQMGVGSINPVRIAVAAWEWGAYLGDDGIKKGIRAKVSSFTRMHVNVNVVRGKITGQYVNSVLAKREAMLSGYDEAIMLDAQGFVAEATGENIFMVKDGAVFTPPLSSPVLAGITRNSVMKILKDQGIEVKQTTFTRDSLYIADEVFFTGTAAEITPVREVDNRKVGTGMPGPITQKVQQTYMGVVRGSEPKYKEWLTYL
jgi:branched-chain amino acid aminotransferase